MAQARPARAQRQPVQEQERLQEGWGEQVQRQTRPIVPPRLLSAEPRLVAPGDRILEVVVSIDVDAEGAAGNCTIVTSSGEGSIDRRALEVARAMRFSPARQEQGGVPIAARVRYRFRFRPAEVRAPAPVDSAPSGVPALGLLRGRVLDAATGRPIRGARVVLAGRLAAGIAPVETGADGRFELPAPAGAHHVRISHGGHRPVEIDETLHASEALAVTYRLSASRGSGYETTVFGGGVRQELGRTTLAMEEMRAMPGGMGDPFRAIEALPGVATAISGLPYYFVRGAPPGDTGYFLDGVRLPQLFHFALGPAVVHPELIDRVDFFPGGFPVRHGRYVGGIVSALTAPPDPDRIRAEANVRLIDTGALFEAPLLSGRATVLGAGRFSYTGAVVSLLAPGVELAYWDYQLRADYAPVPGQRFTLLAFGSFDRLVGTDQFGHTLAFQVEFHRLDLRFDQALARGGRLRIGFQLGRDLTLIPQLGTVSETLGGPRLELEVPLSRRARLRLGADAISQRFELAVGGGGGTADEVERIFPPRNAVVAGAYADLLLRPSDDLELVPGVRADLYSSAGVTHAAVDPRLSLRLELDPSVAIKGSMGLFHQPPSFIVPTPGLQPDLEGGLQESLQLSQGVELRLPWDFSLDAQLFLHRYTNLSDLVINPNRSGSGGSRSPFVRISGQAYGMELLLRRALSRRLFGWIGYTLSRSTRDFPEDGTLPSDFDQTHLLNVVASYEFGYGFRAGARFSYHTGRPVTPRIDSAFPIDLPGSRNSFRLPPFWRLDARVEKHWRFGDVDVNVYLDFANVTLNKETLDYRCYADLSGLTCTPIEIGPVAFFSLGVQAAYTRRAQTAAPAVSAIIP